jgi:hypothetical protein
VALSLALVAAHASAVAEPSGEVEGSAAVLATTVTPRKPSVFADRRARVALVFAVPALWMTMCRLPSGRDVTLPTGGHLGVLGLGHQTVWTANGRSAFLNLA